MLDLVDDRGDLRTSSTGELDRLGDERVELLPREAQARIGGESVEEVVALGAALAHLEGHGDRVLLDDLVRGLATDTVLDRGDEHLGRREERQVAAQLALGHGRERPELVEHREERLEQPVDREEGVRKRDPAYDRAEDVALVPLRTGELGRHRGVSPQDDRESVDALARTAVHLVRHRTRADLARLEALGHELVPGHEAHGRRERRRPSGQLHERGHDVVVKRTRIDLTNAGEYVGETEVGGHPLLELGELVGVAVEKIEHVLRRADRAFDATQGITRDQLLKSTLRHEQLISGAGKALAQCRHLRSHVVRAPGDRELVVLDRVCGEAGENSDDLVAHELERTQDLQLLDVLGEVAAGHALVDVLVAGESGELLDPRLHIVTRDLLAVADRLEVDLVDHGLVGLDDARGDVDPQVALGAQHGDPQLALEHDLVLGRPQRGHRGRCVTGRKNVRDRRRARHRRPLVARAVSHILAGTPCSDDTATDPQPGSAVYGTVISPRSASSAMSLRWWLPLSSMRETAA